MFCRRQSSADDGIFALDLSFGEPLGKLFPSFTEAIDK
jgi:hypothetical protein